MVIVTNEDRRDCPAPMCSTVQTNEDDIALRLYIDRWALLARHASNRLFYDELRN